MPDNQVLTVAEVAQRLRVTTRHVYALAARGQIPHVRLGRTLRFSTTEIDSFLAAGGTKPRNEGALVRIAGARDA